MSGSGMNRAQRLRDDERRRGRLRRSSARAPPSPPARPRCQLVPAEHRWRWHRARCGKFQRARDCPIGGSTHISKGTDPARLRGRLEPRSARRLCPDSRRRALAPDPGSPNEISLGGWIVQDRERLFEAAVRSGLPAGGNDDRGKYESERDGQPPAEATRPNGRDSPGASTMATTRRRRASAASSDVREPPWRRPWPRPRALQACSWDTGAPDAR